jgi:hypothetical protein
MRRSRAAALTRPPGDRLKNGNLRRLGGIGSSDSVLRSAGLAAREEEQAELERFRQFLDGVAQRTSEADCPVGVVTDT